jgi:hypothetical protein
MVPIGLGSEVRISFPGAALLTLSIMDYSECEVKCKTIIRIKVDVFCHFVDVPLECRRDQSTSTIQTKQFVRWVLLFGCNPIFVWVWEINTTHNPGCAETHGSN